VVCRWTGGVGGGGTIFGVDETTMTESGVAGVVEGVLLPLVFEDMVVGAVRILLTLECNAFPRYP